MLVPVLPAPAHDVVHPARSAGSLLRLPLALVGAAGVGLALAGAAEGSVVLVAAGAAVWLAAGYTWERASGTYSSG